MARLVIAHGLGTKVYVDHHDQAYRWAERRRIETHPKTGAAQLVEVRETVKEITLARGQQSHRRGHRVGGHRVEGG